MTTHPNEPASGIPAVSMEAGVFKVIDGAPGLTKREYFAACALSGLRTAYKGQDIYFAAVAADVAAARAADAARAVAAADAIASEAVRVADALIAALNHVGATGTAGFPIP